MGLLRPRLWFAARYHGAFDVDPAPAMTSKQADQSIVVPEWIKSVSPIVWLRASVYLSRSEETMREEKKSDGKRARLAWWRKGR